ncbi:hypothetical protein ACFL0T_01175 [Candidatus Omnitrophota bacterium]
MGLFKILILTALLIPAIFVMGTIASSAQTLSPFSVGSYDLPIDKISSAGEVMVSATREITISEAKLIRDIIKGYTSDDMFYLKETMHRIKIMAEKSV